MHALALRAPTNENFIFLIGKGILQCSIAYPDLHQIKRSSSVLLFLPVYNRMCNILSLLPLIICCRTMYISLKENTSILFYSILLIKVQYPENTPSKRPASKGLLTRQAEGRDEKAGIGRSGKKKA
jgi:hypothetical protein